MKKDILSILKEKGPGFTAPSHYFDAIENSVENLLNTDKIPSKKGFITPKNYFENLESSVVKKIKKQSIPEGYFDAIEDKVFDKLKEAEKSKVIDFKSRVKKVLIPLSIAASLLLIFILNYKNNTIMTSQSLTATEIEEYINEDLISLNSYEIAEVYNDTELDDLTLHEDIELSDYLNGIDVESLILEN